MHCSFWVPLKPVQVHWCFLLVNWRSLGTTTQPPFWKKYSTVCISNWKIKNSLKKYIWPPSFKYLHIAHESQQENCSRQSHCGSQLVEWSLLAYCVHTNTWVESTEVCLSSQIWVDFSLFNVFLYSDMSLFLSMMSILPVSILPLW